MSVRTYAFAFIGLHLTLEQLEVKAKVPGCKHISKNKLESAPKFCPECGEKSVKVVDGFIEALKMDLDNDRDPEYKIDSQEFFGRIGYLPPRFVGYRIVRPSYEGDDFFAVGSQVANTNHHPKGDDSYYPRLYTRIDVDKKMLDIKDSMRAVFEPLKLWNEKEFGLFCIQETH